MNNNTDMILKGSHFVTSPIMQLIVFLVAALWFPTVISYHKLRSLKQYKFVISWFCRSEV